MGEYGLLLTGEIDEGEDCSEAMKKKSSTGPPSCALCNNDKAPFQCSQCKTTHYCGVSCQKLDWKAHKKVCNVVVTKKDGHVATIGSKNNVKGDESMTNDQGGIPQGEDYYKKDLVTKKGDASSGEFLVVQGGPMIHLDNSKFTKKEQHALARHNRDVIVEVRNCAMFLSAVQVMVGKVGPSSFDSSLDIREDVATDNLLLTTFGNFSTPPNISPRILGRSIGKTGKRISIDDILSMLRHIPLRITEDTKGHGKDSPAHCRHPDKYIEYSLTLLEGARGMVGKKGPCRFEHGIVECHNRDVGCDKKREECMMGTSMSLPVIVDPPFNCKIHATGELLHIPIGKAGKKVTMHDIISAFHEVSLHEELLKCRKSGRAFYHEGFFVSGKTLFMHWGS